MNIQASSHTRSFVFPTSTAAHHGCDNGSAFEYLSGYTNHEAIKPHLRFLLHSLPPPACPSLPLRPQRLQRIPLPGPRRRPQHLRQLPARLLLPPLRHQRLFPAPLPGRVIKPFHRLPAHPPPTLKPASTRRGHRPPPPSNPTMPRPPPPETPHRPPHTR